MEVRNHRTYCTMEEFIDKCKEVIEPGDKLDMGEVDGADAMTLRNYANCLLACWFLETEEYREF